MQLTLTDQQAQVLAETVKDRLDQLVMSISRADTRDFRDRLVAEGDLLEEVYAQLGCSHPEWSEAKACAIGPESGAVAAG